MEPSSMFVLLLPLASIGASPSFTLTPVEVEPITFSHIVEESTPHGRADELHANRFRVGDNVSLGGLVNFLDAQEDQVYTLNIRITF